MNNTIFLPRKIKVGFQTRNDTYTKKLAHVIYYDEKGKLRKENSWQSWRDKNIEPQEFDNEPTEGFVLNKKVGGYAGHWGEFRQAYVRVYDPRGFEFEITVPNLLYILEYCSAIKGKGLEGKFVYGWDGTDLLLIPTDTPDYQELSSLAEKRFEREFIKAKELVVGATYLTKSNSKLIYMGKFDTYVYGYIFDDQFFATYTRMDNYATKNNKETYNYTREGWMQVAHPNYRYNYGNDGKYFWFWNTETKTFSHMKSISGTFVDTVDPQCTEIYSELYELMQHEEEFSPLDKSKSVYRLTTEEELSKYVRHYPREVSCKYGDIICAVEVSKLGNGKVQARTRNLHGISLLMENFEIHPYRYDPQTKETDEIELSELIEKLNICMIDQYLANGKFYRSVYSE